MTAPAQPRQRSELAQARIEGMELALSCGRVNSGQVWERIYRQRKGVTTVSTASVFAGQVEDAWLLGITDLIRDEKEAIEPPAPVAGGEGGG